MTKLKVEDDGLYDVPEIAAILGITDRTVRKMLREGKFKGRRLGKRWYVPGSAIKAYFLEDPDDK
jgi:excisionase family DNA binding protein